MYILAVLNARISIEFIAIIIIMYSSGAESTCLEYLSKSTSIGSFSYSIKSKSIAQKVYLSKSKK